MMQVNIGGERRLSLSDRLTRSSAAGLITFYQRYISPHKGFRCAHRVHHGGRSCSAYAKTMVQSYGVGAAIPLIRQRFRDCGEAARILRSQQDFFTSRERRQERRDENCASWCSSGDCGLSNIGDCSLFESDGCGCAPELEQDCGLFDLGDGCVGDCGQSCDMGQGCDFGADGCGEAIGGCGADFAGEACTGCVPSIRLPRWSPLK